MKSFLIFNTETGKYWGRRRYYGGSWVDKPEQAKRYGKIGPARCAVTAHRLKKAEIHEYEMVPTGKVLGVNG